MNAAEYANLDAVERTHWYYAGKRELVRWWLAQIRPPRADEILLDYGAGTGRFAIEMQTYCRVLVLDDHAEALSILRERFAPSQVLAAQDDAIPVADSSIDCLTALDVLEHLRNDDEKVAEFRRVLKSGGLAVVTVPAGMALWSDWDEALHHFRRYNRSELLRLFPRAHWDIVHVNYTNVLAYPAVWIVRKARRLRRGRSSRPIGPRAEDLTPPRWLNALLQGSFVRLGRSRIRFPFGVSLILVARKL
jgi:SAM-dependent methyltransferase